MTTFHFLLPLLALALTTCATHAPERGPVTVMLAAINDFHGNLEQPAGGVPEISAAKGELMRTPAGGVARLATALERLRAQHAHFAFVSSGDSVGASPFASGYFDDEPAIEAMNSLKLDFNGVGNHEFDRGRAALQRLQSGGCPRGGCKSGQPFGGAKFAFLAANVKMRDTGTTLFAPYAVREFSGVKVAFIGVTLKETPAILPRVVTANAVNHVVRTDLPENPLLAALAARQAQLLKQLDRAVGRITQAIVNIQNADGESPLGQLIADAHLEAIVDAGADNLPIRRTRPHGRHAKRGCADGVFWAAYAGGGGRGAQG